jgi:hypothetical protein
MKKFRKDDERGHVYYYCPQCSHRLTCLPSMNGASEDWPRDVFDEAVAKGIVTPNGAMAR